jgi:hypothetical protein
LGSFKGGGVRDFLAASCRCSNVVGVGVVVVVVVDATGLEFESVRSSSITEFANEEHDDLTKKRFSLSHFC